MPPLIDSRTCISCGNCVFMCGRRVLKIRLDSDKSYPAKAKDCIDCFICTYACPTGSITVKPVKR